jgi:hypothetical protein
VVVTPEELADITEAIRAVLAPYVVREPSDRPADARGVLLLRYLLPEAADGDE